MGEDENAPAGGVPEADDQSEQGKPEARPQASHGLDLPADPPLPADPNVPAGDGAPEPYRRAQAMITGAAYGALGVFGLALGVFGSFLYSWMLGPVPIAALAFAVLNLAAVRLAGWGMSSKLGAVIPTVTWLVVVFSLSTKRAEGDLVITGTAPGYLFIVGGSIAAVIAIALTPSPHSWLLRGADIDASVR